MYTFTPIPYSAAMQIEVNEHLDQIAQFRDSLSSYFTDHPAERIVIDVVNDDRACWRWLKARSFKVADAKTMFIEAADYRRTHSMDDILSRPFPKAALIHQHSQDFWHSVDRNNVPVFIERFGQIDVSALSKVASNEERVHYHHYINEFVQQVLLPLASKRAGHLIDRVTSIFDMTGLSRSHMTAYNRQFVFDIIKINALIYPELMERTVVVNCPFVFSLAWNLVKPVIDSATRAKIMIKSSISEKEWSEHFYVDRLPEYVGGTHQCESSGTESDCSHCPTCGEEVRMFHSIIRQAAPSGLSVSSQPANISRMGDRKTSDSLTQEEFESMQNQNDRNEFGSLQAC